MNLKQLKLVYNVIKTEKIAFIGYRYVLFMYTVNNYSNRGSNWSLNIMIAKGNLYFNCDCSFFEAQIKYGSSLLD